MKSLFDKPQRQSSIGILIMFFDTLQTYVRALWPILVLWIFKFQEVNKIYLLLGIIGIIIVIGLIAYFKYLNFTFYLNHENQEFVIEEGIFNKTKTTIQLHKIQQVNINQTIIQRIIGVYTLDVDTAGSNKKEGKIRAISHLLATELKSSLLDNLNKIDFEKPILNTETTQVLEDYPFIKISLISLIKTGITSNYIKSFSLLLLFFFSLSDYINKITGRDLLQDGNIKNYVDNSQVQTFLFLILALFCIVLIINLVRIIFKYFDYKITKQKGSLLLSFGLLNAKSTIIKPEKVQITIVTRNYFQKKMNILQLKIKQATGGEKEEHKSAIEIPGCNSDEHDEILKLLFKKIPEKGVMLKPNFRKLVFALFLTIGIPLFGYYIFRIYNPTLGANLNYFLSLYVIMVGTLQYFIFKNNRLFIHDDFIIKQSGAWDISNEIIEPHKIQAITTSQLFWHKKINIGSIILHTAGGNIAFQLGNFTTLKKYINQWLYEIETSDSNWM